MAALFITACQADRIVVDSSDRQSRLLFVGVGQELRVRLGNVGPTGWEDPPQVSSNVLTYLDETVVPPFTPAGPTQEFRFKAISEGVAVIKFRLFFSGSVVAVVEDTVGVHQ